MRKFEKEKKMLKPSEISVDQLYQRSIDARRVAKIVKEWNDNLVNPPKVSFRDGKYWVFDGQHTTAAWRAKKGDKPLECVVFYGMDWEDEMRLFVSQNGLSKIPSTNDKLKALFHAGDVAVINMVEICKNAGVTVDFARGQKWGRCCATACLYRWYNILGGEKFSHMIFAVADSWGGEPASLSASIISGVAKFYFTYFGQFQQSDLVNVLKMISPSEIIREGRVMGGGKATNYARAILKAYNKRRRKKLKDTL